MDEERNNDTNRIIVRTGTWGNVLPLLQRVWSYSRLIRVTSWILRYVYNSWHQTLWDGILSTGELKKAEIFWLGEAQSSVFSNELCLLRNNKPLPLSSKLTIFHPFIDGEGLLRIGGRMELSKLSYTNRHPVILPCDHRVVDLLIIYEHLQLLHAGPTPVSASLAQWFCIICGRRTICAKIHNCVTCKRIGARAKPQLMGQLPIVHLNPWDVFDDTGVDYAGPIYIKTRQDGKIRVVTVCTPIGLYKKTNREGSSDSTSWSQCLKAIPALAGGMLTPESFWMAGSNGSRQLLRHSRVNRKSFICRTLLLLAVTNSLSRSTVVLLSYIISSLPHSVQFAT